MKLKKLVRIITNILGYIQACKVENILYLDTKHCIQEHTTYTHNLLKFQKKNDFMIYWQKCVFTKGAFMEKYWHLGHFFTLGAGT